MDEPAILAPLYDPRLPWWVSALAALGLVVCVLVATWAFKLLLVG